MATAQSREEFVSFMVDYTAFLGRMRSDETEKLSALNSRDIQRIEHSLSVCQANAKQLENYEARRGALQAAAGYGELTFRELIGKAPAEDQDHLWSLFSRFEHNVAEIRFLNDRSMSVARDNMVAVNPESAPQGPPKNPYEKIKEDQNRKSMMLEQKA